MANLNNTTNVLFSVDGHSSVLPFSEALEAMATAILEGRSARIQYGLDSLVWGVGEEVANA